MTPIPSEEILDQMMAVGALMIKNANAETLKFDINFNKMQQHFPSWMNYFIEANLSPDQLFYYHNGLIAYTINEDGSLTWKLTRKGRE